jgi:hypothetical protein
LSFKDVQNARLSAWLVAGLARSHCRIGVTVFRVSGRHLFTRPLAPDRIGHLLLSDWHVCNLKRGHLSVPGALALDSFYVNLEARHGRLAHRLHWISHAWQLQLALPMYFAERCCFWSMQAIPGLSEKVIVFDKLPEWLLIDDEGEPITRSENSPAQALGLILGLGLSTAEVLTHHGVFSLSNLVACMVATDILQLIGIRSFKTAAVLFTGAITAAAAAASTITMFALNCRNMRSTDFCSCLILRLRGGGLSPHQRLLCRVAIV